MSGTYDHQEHQRAHDRGVYYHVCRSCGCTDQFPCLSMGTIRCSWVEDDLCSRCDVAPVTHYMRVCRAVTDKEEELRLAEERVEAAKRDLAETEARLASLEAERDAILRRGAR